MSAEIGSKAKRTSLLVRRSDLTMEEFRTHWAGPHAAIATTMPGIACYTQNRVDRVLWIAPSDDEPYKADGIVELEFESERAMAEAGKSEAVRRLLPEDEPRFMSAITLCQVPTGAQQIRPGHTKVMVAARLADGKDIMDLFGVLAATNPLQVSVDPVFGAAHRDVLAYEREEPHAFATLWFEPERSLASVFGPESEWQLAATQGLKRGTAWLIDPLPIVSGKVTG